MRGTMQNSIRHNLSTNKWFVKCERDMVHEPGYSAMWTVDTTSKGGELFPLEHSSHIIQADDRIWQAQRRSVSDSVEARKAVRCSLLARRLRKGSFLTHELLLLQLQ